MVVLIDMLCDRIHVQGSDETYKVYTCAEVIRRNQEQLSTVTESSWNT